MTVEWYAERVLQTLRYGSDQLFLDPMLEELWWLKRVPANLPRRGYLTGCCPAAWPCERHARFELS